MTDSAKENQAAAAATVPPDEDSTPGKVAPIDKIEDTPKGDSLDISGPAGEIMDAAPDVSEHFDRIEGREAAAPVEDRPEPEKVTGEFNPKIHRADKDGNPIINKDGSFARKPGRKKGKVYDSSGSTVAGQSKAPELTPEQIAAQNAANGAKAAAVVAVTQVEIVGRMIGGEEWAYIKNDEYGIDERAAGTDAFSRYFEAAGVVDIPPGVALALWGFGYVAPRFTMPKTKSRARLVKAWISDKFARFRGRKGKVKQSKEVSDNGARSDIGDDRERQDNAGD